MADPAPDPGKDVPREPEHSLPLYSDPPLRERRNRNLDREEVAERDLKGTVFRPGAKGLLIAAFLLTISVPSVLQFAAELHAGRGLPSFDIIRAMPKWEKIRAARHPADFWNLTPQADDIKDFEKGMEKGSVISRWLLPHVQDALTHLGAGNEQAYPGRPGWLFYRPDVEYAIGPPFLDPGQIDKRNRASHVRADPIPAILDFRDQLKARGIELVLLPIPVKPVIDGEMLSGDAKIGQALQNPSFAEFKARLEKTGVRVFDPTDLLLTYKAVAPGVFELFGKPIVPGHPENSYGNSIIPKPGAANSPLYLETDTHWRPETMHCVAEALARFLEPGANPGFPHEMRDRAISELGDIALMLKLPAEQTIYSPQKVTIRQVITGNSSWRATPGAETLLLGDSFSNIFSLEGMGWGESAGFAEHLSASLGKPIDAILRNSDASFATREILSRELARGHDRLAGKKLVVWEFAARELSGGNWKLLPMKLGQPPESHFFSPKPGEDFPLTGTVESVSSVPLPGSVPYKDHILTVHLTDLSPEGMGESAGKGAGGGSLQALVYLWSMRDNVWTPAARLRAGDPVKVRLRAWSDVSAEYEKINRSELDDPALQLEEPVWGELVQ